MSLGYFETSRMNIARQTDFKTPAATGFVTVPYYTHTLGSSRGFVEQNPAGFGRDPSAPGKTLNSHGGDVVVPVDISAVGHWFRAMFGAPLTTGADDYTHAFESGEVQDGLDYYTVVAEHDEPGLFLQHTGVTGNTMQMSVEKSEGFAQLTFGLLGYREAKRTAAISAPATYTDERIQAFAATLTKDGSAFANVTNLSLSFANGKILDQQTINGTPDPEKIDLGPTSGQGTLAARLSDTEIYDLMDTGDAFACEALWELSSTKSLKMTWNAVRFAKEPVGVPGPGGLSISAPIRVEKPGGDNGPALTVELKNQVASY